MHVLYLNDVNVVLMLMSLVSILLCYGNTVNDIEIATVHGALK